MENTLNDDLTVIATGHGTDLVGNDVTYPADQEERDTATAEVDFPASLGDFIRYDLDKDGLQDEDELALPNVGIALYSSEGGFAAPVAATVSDAAGFYEFMGLDPDFDYQVQFTNPLGFQRTLAVQGADAAVDSDAGQATGRTGTVDLDSGELDPTIDAGFVATDPGLTVDEVCVLGDNELDETDELVSQSLLNRHRRGVRGRRSG